MKAYKLASICTLAYICLPQLLFAQDRDIDGINDILEQKLALRFAPEWRFNYRVDGDNSSQNHNEVAFPSSVEWFYTEVEKENGLAPYLRFKHGDAVSYATIPSMDQLAEAVDPWSNQRTDSPYWDDRRESIRIVDYPKWIGGTPETFPTYYHCDILDDGNLVIQYYLWFPWDYAGRYDLPFFITVEKGWHRGDWENITVVLRGILNPNNIEIPAGATIEKVIYYGHFVPGKIVYPGTSSYFVVDGTHPQVFVAWGTHAMHPEPGEWHNHEFDKDPFFCEECDDAFDDFFHGNGYVAQSWHPARELINLGEHIQEMPNVSFRRWIRFRGLWGEDGDSENGSPPSPIWRGRWFTSGKTDNWETIKNNYRQHYWEKPPELDGAIANEALYAEGPPRVVLFADDHWRHGLRTVKGVTTTILPYIVDPDGRDGVFPSSMASQASSVLLLGGARVTLFSGNFFSGQSLELTHSCPDLKRHYNHDFGDKARSAIVTIGSNQVYVDRSNAAGYQDGAALPGRLSGPYSTIGRALFHVNKGGVIIAKSGTYPEILTLDKTVTINSEGGVVVIGKLDQ